MRMRIARGTILKMISPAFIAMCGCGSGAASDAGTQATKAPSTAAPVRHYKATKAQLHNMREKWSVSIMMLDTPAANVLGVIQQLVENRDESRDYPFLIDAPNGESAVANLPRDWHSARSSLQNVANAVSAARNDFQSWKEGADFDDALRSKLAQDGSDIVDSLCKALHEARTYYATAGGYANDLSFVLMSDKGDRSCQNVGMAHAYTTVIKRRALATVAESTNELPESNVEEAFLNDHTGFVIPAGTAVQVIGHRYSDSTEITLCQVHGGGGTGWVPCSWLARTPRATDG
jgi:hypothetical protein